MAEISEMDWAQHIKMDYAQNLRKDPTKAKKLTFRRLGKAIILSEFIKCFEFYFPLLELNFLNDFNN